MFKSEKQVKLILVIDLIHYIPNTIISTCDRYRMFSETLHLTFFLCTKSFLCAETPVYVLHLQHISPCGSRILSAQ